MFYPLTETRGVPEKRTEVSHSLQLTRSCAETGNAIPGGSTSVTQSRQIVPAKHR